MANTPGKNKRDLTAAKAQQPKSPKGSKLPMPRPRPVRR